MQGYHQHRIAATVRGNDENFNEKKKENKR